MVEVSKIARMAKVPDFRNSCGFRGFRSVGIIFRFDLPRNADKFTFIF